MSSSVLLVILQVANLVGSAENISVMFYWTLLVYLERNRNGQRP